MRSIPIFINFLALFALFQAGAAVLAEENPRISAPQAELNSSKSSARTGLPEAVERLSPEAKALWQNAKIKPVVPPALYKKSPSEQVRLLTIISTLEARQSEVAELEKDAPKIEDYTKWRKSEDRAELIKPAPKNFKPTARRKIKLTLIPQKAMIRKGESFWYRLEMQNQGSEIISLNERPSFWKVGNENGPLMRYSFYVTPPGGQETRIPFQVVRGPDIPYERNYPDGLKDSEKESYVKRFKARQARDESRRAHLIVDLAPGEILSARPWAFGKGVERLASIMNGENPDPVVSGPWRELTSILPSFDKPGTYHIKFIYDDSLLPSPRIKTLGAVESNVVTIEVVP